MGTERFKIKEKEKKELRKLLYGLAFKNRASHVGPSLSCLDIIYEVYQAYNLDDVKLILSKGHGVMALYTVLHHMGVISDEEWATIFQAGSKFIGHVPNLPSHFMEVPTGSLGHGLSVACGIAFAKPTTDVVCILGDGETNEGSIWEAFAFAAKYNHGNLKIIVDWNGVQGFDKCEHLFNNPTEDYNLRDKVEGFGLFTVFCHSSQIQDLLIQDGRSGPPTVFFVQSEKSLESHYSKMTLYQYQKHMVELDES